MSSLVATVPENCSDPDLIDFVSPAVQEMRKDWALVTALRGTRSMREGETLWLSQEEGESDRNYQARLKRAYLFPAFYDQSKRLVAKPFSQPVQLKGGDVPESLADLEDNTDGLGRSLTATMSDFALDAIQYGLSHLVIDFPATEDKSRAPIVRGEVRPTWRHIQARHVLGWRSVHENGSEVLDEIRFRDDREEDVGEYGTMVVPYIVHMTRGFVQRWSWEGNEKGWVAGDEIPYRFNRGDDREPMFRVPMVTAYTNQTGFMTATPPLMGLADLNLAHWQSTAAQRNVVHYVRVPLLVITGLDNPDDMKKPTVVSSAKALKYAGKDVKVNYAEHQGKGAEVGQRDLEILEDQMEVLGLQPNVRKTVAATATSQRVKEGRTTTQMQEWLRRFETAAEQGYEFSAVWMEEDLPEDFGVDIFSDFSVDPGDATQLTVLLSARVAGEIPRRVFLDELKRRAALSEDVDTEEIDRELQKEELDREERMNARMPIGDPALDEGVDPEGT